MIFSKDSIASQVLCSTRHFIPCVENLPVPIDLNYLASCLGYIIEEARIQQQGYITDTEDGKRLIRVRIDDPLRVKRFTIAHEIGHILLNIYEKKSCRRAKKFRLHAYSREEKIANRLAAEVLMPVSRFRHELLRHVIPSFATLGAMAGTFDVSLIACMRRITELPDFISFSYLYEFTRRSKDRLEVNLQNRYSSTPNLRFVEKPSEVVERCYAYSLSKGRNWEGKIRMVADHQVAIPSFLVTYKKKDKFFVRLSGWKKSDKAQCKREN